MIDTRSVFEDLYGPGEHSTNLEIRARLIMHITQWMKAHGLSQAGAAQQLGVSRVRVSYLLNGHIEKFSIDKLVNLISKTDMSVSLKVEPADENNLQRGAL